MIDGGPELSALNITPPYKNTVALDVYHDMNAMNEYDLLGTVRGFWAF